jgi:hypothetical protein
MRYECACIGFAQVDAMPTFLRRDADRGPLPWSTGKFNRIRLRVLRTRTWRESPRVRRRPTATCRRDRLVIRRRYGGYMRRQRRH